jgi:hypothetical protein
MRFKGLLIFSFRSRQARSMGSAQIFGRQTRAKKGLI